MPFWLKHGTAALTAVSYIPKAMSSVNSDMVMVEPEKVQQEAHAALTTEHVAQKSKAKMAEDTVQRALGFDEMEVDFGGDEDVLVSKTSMDHMEAANTILATDFEHPNQAEEAMQRMALCERSAHAPGGPIT